MTSSMRSHRILELVGIISWFSLLNLTATSEQEEYFGKTNDGNCRRKLRMKNIKKVPLMADYDAADRIGGNVFL